MRMPDEVRERYLAYLPARTTWDPVDGGRAPLIRWHDHVDRDLGVDADGARFERISSRMLSGHYYPDDVIECFGPWQDEGREIRPGDRMLQKAHAFGLTLWAMVEIFAAERTASTCTLGYVTTERHFGRGMWQATLTRSDGVLGIEVEGISGPGSWMFWLFLPFARYVQKRAWRRALQEFSRL